jgi:hypothetical protein
MVESQHTIMSSVVDLTIKTAADGPSALDAHCQSVSDIPLLNP